MTGKNRIMIYGPKDDGTYIVEFKTAADEVLAISIPRTECAVIRHFQERMPYGLFVNANCFHPGLVATGFNRNNGLQMDLGMTILRLPRKERARQWRIVPAYAPAGIGDHLPRNMCRRKGVIEELALTR